MIRIVVVDDHDLVRLGITRLLQDTKDIKVIGEATCGEDALTVVRSLEPDVVLMDIKMPGIGGLEATRKLKKMMPQVSVLALTVCDGAPFASRLMEAGASGYITKGAGLEEMVLAIRQVAKGMRYISSEIAQQVALHALGGKSNASPFELLSQRELQIALLIANCQNVAFISEQLFLSPKTVNTYRYRIFEKLNIQSDVELALLAVRHGMIDVEKEQMTL